MPEAVCRLKNSRWRQIRCSRIFLLWKSRKNLHPWRTVSQDFWPLGFHQKPSLGLFKGFPERFFMELIIQLWNRLPGKTFTGWWVHQKSKLWSPSEGNAGESIRTLNCGVHQKATLRSPSEGYAGESIRSLNCGVHQKAMLGSPSEV